MEFNQNAKERASSAVQTCGDAGIGSGRQGVPGVYAFFARYVLMPWESCLDVGGGLGVGRGILLRRSRHVRSIDRDERLTEYSVELGRVEDEADASVDWVLAVDVVEHVEDAAGFLRHLWRVSRKGVFVSTPNLDHHPNQAWPYHVREYGSVEFGQMVALCCPDAKSWQFGGGVYGGSLSVRHVNPAWEHQAILVLRKRRMVSCVLALREALLRVLRSDR